MKAQAERNIKLSFPFGLYLRQLFAPNIYVRSFNPFTFWRRYRIRYLESCWEINLVRCLERCRRLEWQPEPKPSTPRKSIVAPSGIYRGLPWQMTPQHTLIISQPPLVLKYRGVTYLTNSNQAIATNKSTDKTSQITSNSSEKVSLSNNIDDAK